VHGDRFAVASEARPRAFEIEELLRQGRELELT